MSQDDSRPVYSMQVAASLLRVHPQTLRNYERAGLIRPERSGGGQRLYSAADIQRLAQLLALTDRHGLTMESLALLEKISAGLERLARLLAAAPDAEHWTAAKQIVHELQALLSPPDQPAP
jgi:MerR family transcriptional regulator/heat shock protein HspR